VTPDALHTCTLASLSRAIESRDVSPVEVAEACLRRIERLDRTLNAFITVTADRALAAARRAEQEIAAGRRRGPLHGVPIALKDLVATAGVRTTCGSRILRDWVPAEDAAVVQRLHDAGAVILGKLNMSEFAYAAIHADYGPPRNPWNPERFTGGSSSGSAAAVAAGLCFGATGTDTGGSIRSPAAHCGIVGLKPTYGLVSRAGIVPLAWSLDHVGPMARTVEDAAILLDAMAGFDPADPTSTPAAPDSGARPPLDASVPAVRSARLGAVGGPLADATSPEVAARVRDAVRVLAPLVAAVEDVSLPMLEDMVAAWWTICLVEASAYHQQTLAERAQDFGPIVRERLEAGLVIPGVQYVQAQRVRRAAVLEFDRLLGRVDLLVLPATFAEAPPIAAADAVHASDALRRRIVPMAPFNLLGLPAVSVPCGFTDAGLPVGLQIAGRRGEDRLVLAAAHLYEQAAGWWTRRPPVDGVSQTSA
jgi:Asp-tRNA(Asn)/Glu-tRNA(Gln) amidotransferase A subunit family amidase